MYHIRHRSADWCRYGSGGASSARAERAEHQDDLDGRGGVDLSVVVDEVTPTLRFEFHNVLFETNTVRRARVEIARGDARYNRALSVRIQGLGVKLSVFLIKKNEDLTGARCRLATIATVVATNANQGLLAAFGR